MKFRCLALCLFTLFILSVSPAHAFKFDVWISGTTLHEAYSIAKYQKFKLRKSDYSGTASQPLLSREYDDRLLDEPVEVVLFFTPVSKQLFRVYVTWNRANGVRRIPEEKVGAMYQELEQLLSSKYAKGASIISSTHEKSFDLVLRHSPSVLGLLAYKKRAACTARN